MDIDLPLSSEFTCWVQKLSLDKTIDYSQTLKEAFTVATIKEFWKYYQHMIRPSRLKQSDNIYLFKKSVHPSWQALANKGGGCLKVRLRKPKSNRQWQDIMLAVISPDNKFIDDINGVRLKIREKYDQVEIWLPKLKTEDRQVQIKEYIRRYVFSDDESPPSIDYKNF